SSLTLTSASASNAPGSDVEPTGSATKIGMPGYSGLPPADSMNYIRSRTITKPGITDPATAAALGGAYDAHQATEYFDGLGRSQQMVDKQNTPAQGDLVSATFYDPFGRVAQQYLPYTDTLSTGQF